MSIYKQRVLELRRLMKENNIDAYLILSADPHLSEYLPEYYKTESLSVALRVLLEQFLSHKKRAFVGRWKILASSTKGIRR